MKIARKFATIVFGITCLTTAQQTIAEEQKVKFHAFSSLSPETGVHAMISVIYPDNTTQKFPTSGEGRVEMKLKSCDASVTIEARSIWGNHTKTSATCNPVPVKLAMVPSVQAAAVSEVLREVLYASNEDYSGNARSYFTALRAAVETGDVAAAAVEANNLQWTLFVAGETASAYEYGIFAQSAGFEAMALANLVKLGEAESEFRDVMVVDHARDLVVMSASGQSYLTQAQRELGLAANGAWDGATFRSLRSNF